MIFKVIKIKFKQIIQAQLLLKGFVCYPLLIKKRSITKPVIRVPQVSKVYKLNLGMDAIKHYGNSWIPLI